MQQNSSDDGLLTVTFQTVVIVQMLSIGERDDAMATENLKSYTWEGFQLPHDV